MPLHGYGDNADSIFLQLMKMRARDDSHLPERLEKKTNKYVPHDVQNELLKVMALSVVRDISCAIQESCFYFIICDECTDASNKEQLVICIRWCCGQLYNGASNMSGPRSGVAKQLLDEEPHIVNRDNSGTGVIWVIGYVIH